MRPSAGNDASAKGPHVEMLDDPIKPSSADQADIEDRPLKERRLVRKIDVRMSVMNNLDVKVLVQLLILSQDALDDGSL